ncbi:MAG: AsmA-like C-terminal region-containing protein [Bacteroidota bacterium]
MNSNFNISFRLNQWKNIQKENIQDILCKGEFTLEDIDIQLKDHHIAIHDLDGKITLDDETTSIHHLECNINEDPVKIQGSISRFIEYLIHPHEANLWYNGDLYSSGMNIHRYFSPKNNKKEAEKTRPFRLPERIFGKLNIQIDQLTWDSFNGRNFSGTLVNKKKSIALKSASINTMKSFIRFDASLWQKDTNKMVLKFNTNLKRVNIQELFKSFDNFGQKTLQAENIEGKVSGNIDLGLHFTPQFKVLNESIVSKASITIENGALIKFEPMYELSKFIKVSELEDIRFKTLKNTLFIRNNKLIIPEMDIHSSAFNISGSGIHHFDNLYTHHVKVLLSEILSKKARKAKKENQEFGVIEDDGVGNTSLYLTIEGDKDGTSVKYDRKKVKEVIKQRFKEEKNELKSVLHKEFGWYKKDSALKEKNENERDSKDFVIEWDENDKKDTQKDNTTKEKKEPEKKETQNKKKEKKQFNIEWETR